MQKLTALNPASTPLNTRILIEASAGTGKTYTIASLYLRLLLQAGQQPFSRPLTVEQILVVTFTEAATQELKERIRQRVHLAKEQLTLYSRERDKSVFKGTDNDILAELVEDIEDPDLAVQRLHIAEQNMDLAAIYTIHGFCHRMLMQYAFDAGMHFNLQLMTDETPLLEKAVQDFWRIFFYPQPLGVANFIHCYLISPQAVLKNIKPYITGEKLYAEITPPSLLTISFTDFMTKYVAQSVADLAQFKQNWLMNEQELQQRIKEAKANKKLKAASFRENDVAKRFDAIRAWAKDETAIHPPEALYKYFRQSALNTYLTEGSEPIEHAVFAAADDVFRQIATDSVYVKVILYHYIQWVREAILTYKLNRPEKSYNDLLRLLKDALQGEQGESLAQLIRHQYPFAMIDEFQDTDNQQYQIFYKIYMQKSTEPTGLIMIGDPKQAIYKFRGADIFTYLKAAKQVSQRFTLSKNYRSERHLVEAINGLFDFPNAPFLYEDIQFSTVTAREDHHRFTLNGKVQAPLAFYVGDYTKEQCARLCAASVCQWLQSAGQGKVGFQIEPTQNTEPLRAKDIAVLVRNRYEAEAVKQALGRLGIASVYLSDRSNVFDCQEAKDLFFILTACLNPFNERHILNAVSTALFTFTSAEILSIKQDERLLERWVKRFEHYRNLWQWQGILPMIHQLLLDSDTNQDTIPEKLLSLPNGERRLTDILHLAELLQQAAALNESEAALLHWFERRIQGENRTEEQQIRLESELELVKIVTIHKSKGLEYGLVWLPFIGIDMAENRSDNLITTYYNRQAQDIRWDMSENHREEVLREQRAEDMRLLYVALTRAKYHIAMTLSTKFKHWNALHYALSGGNPTADQTSQEHLKRLAAKIGSQNLQIDEDTVMSAEPLSVINDNGVITAAQFHGHIERNWIVSSFSGLAAKHDKNLRNTYYKGMELAESAVGFSSIFDHAADYDPNYFTDNLSTETSDNESWRHFEEGYAPVDLPAGRKMGLALHNLLEKTDFTQDIPAEHIKTLCADMQLDEVWFTPVRQWLNHILHTPLCPTDEQLTLKQIAPQYCLKEMQFYLKLSSEFSVQRFNRILRKYGLGTENGFLWDDIQGMIRGFIDLSFTYNGQYYLLDYKSNLLGKSLQDYAQARLPQVMRENHYDLQYILYILALNRYLQLRDSQYCYERHFGGVIYTFLRGMNGENGQYGVFFTCPQADLIHELEPLFYA